jgi:hypothetical protein
MIYNLQDIGALENDLTFILDRISSIYQISFEGNKINISPNIDIKTDAYFTTDEHTKDFNRHIPNFKSVHGDMYAFIESLSRLKTGRFVSKEFDDKFENFKEFRLLNNMFKHPQTKECEIKFSKVVHFFQNKFSLLCNFHYPDSFKCLMYSDFIVLFFKILLDFDAITIKDDDKTANA